MVLKAQDVLVLLKLMTIDDESWSFNRICAVMSEITSWSCYRI
jgi:hypothetical protein